MAMPRVVAPSVIYARYTQSLNVYTRLEPAHAISSDYLTVLQQTDDVLYRTYTVEALQKRLDAADQAAALFDALTAYKNSLENPLNLPQDRAIEGQAFQATQELTYLNIKSFIRSLLADGHYDQTQIELATRLVTQLRLVHEAPRHVPSLIELNNLQAKLASQFETGTFSNAVYTAGRVLLGSLEAVLGLAIMMAGLTTGIGLLLSLGIAAYTTCASEKTHWGPLTWGNRLFWGGIDLAKSGPTLFQREAACRIEANLNDMKPQMEALQPRVI